MPSPGTGWAGRRKELVAGGAQGHVRTLLSSPVLSCPDVQGQSRASPSPCLLPGGGGSRGRQPICRSQSQRWQYFKVWYILSLPGICMYFLSSACYDKSVKI